MKKTLFTLIFLSLSIYIDGAVTTGTKYMLYLGNKVLSITNSSLAESAKLNIWTKTDVSSQCWVLVSAGEEKYIIKNVYTGKCINYSGTKSEGAFLCQRRESITKSTGTWTIKPVSGKTDTYKICLAADENYCIKSTNSYANGAGVELGLTSDADSLTTWRVETQNSIQEEFNEAVRDSMIDGFINHYYHSASNGHILGGGGWWGDAEMFETILDAFETTGNKKYQIYFSELYKNFITRNGTNWCSSNQYNDDITWMVLACIRAYKFFGTIDYLTNARTNYDNMYLRAAVLPMGTLIWKQETGARGTNSCINCPAMVAACYLAQITGDNSYYTKAMKIYAGQRSKLFNTSDGHVYDSCTWNSDNTTTTTPNYWASTYNQGTMLGSAIMLYEHTHNAMYLQDAENIYNYTIKNLCNGNGIINVCQTVSGDLCGFKGIFMRYARRYAQDLKHQDALTWIAKNAYQAYQNRNSVGVTWSKWLTKTSEDFIDYSDGNKNIDNDAFGASTAVSAAANAHINAIFKKDAFSTIGVECFDDIKWWQIANEKTDYETPETTYGKNGSYLCFKNVDFGTNIANSITMRIAANVTQAKIIIYTDSIVDACKIYTSDYLSKGWNSLSADINSLGGVHDIYFVVSTGNYVTNAVSLHNFSFSSATTGISQTKDDANATSLCYTDGCLVTTTSSAATLTLFNVSGEQLLRIPIHKGTEKITLSGVPNGIYVAMLDAKDIKATRKFEKRQS
jgi:predicted alpha-1,6-mannanase (GH76 family)